MGRSRRRWQVVAVAVLVALAASSAPTAVAYRGAPRLPVGQPYDQNFPDPHVIYVDGVYYGYATNTGGPLIPTLTSTDLETWYAARDPLAEPPDWAVTVRGRHSVWAPAVAQVGGGWRAYYAIRERNGSQPRYCVSVATGPSPLGPFVDRSEEPLTCGLGPAGAIDPWVHVDGRGTPWLLWKSEPSARVGFIPRLPAALWSRPLTPDGLHFDPAKPANVLLSASSSGWEGGIVENPALFDVDGVLHLLYSGNRYGSPDYATGWARCETPAGPCSRASSGPILASHGDQNGPGGASVFEDGFGDLRIAYHAWNAPYSSYPSWPSCDTDGDLICADEGQRFMHVALLCAPSPRTITVGRPEGWRFCDVDPAKWFGPGVTWMEATAITTGISPNRFAPHADLTRAQMVTMLWRWAGYPAPDGPSPFTDVPDRSYYTSAVAWAAERGIVTGTSPTTFSPAKEANRAQIAVILHRAAGSPEPGQAAPFTDVATGAYFTDAVAWAAQSGIVTGFTPTKYAPSEPTTRAQVATLLCRFSANPAAAGPEAVVGAVPACPNP